MKHLEGHYYKICEDEAQGRCVFERRLSPFIYTSLKVVWRTIFGVSTSSTASCMPSCHRLSKGWPEAPVGGQATIGVGRPLNKSPHHRLRMAGYGLDMVRSSVGFSSE